MLSPMEGVLKVPKVTITFNLPEEESDLNLCRKAAALNSVIYEFTNVLRSKTKYGDGKKIAREDVSSEWWNLLNEDSIDPYSE